MTAGRVEIMFDNYRTVFTQRGEWYHSAMRAVPNARQFEFETVIDVAAIEAGHVVFDIPSGGGYLSRFLEVPIELVSVETSEIFLSQAEQRVARESLLCEKMTELPVKSEIAYRVISVAGLHHEENQPEFFREALRLLKPEGRLCLADVRADSAVDRFLNEFVNRHNSMGHRGIFLGSHTRDQIEQIGFQILQAEPIAYEWCFANVVEMTSYCRNLFGLDRATSEEIIEGITEYLGFVKDDKNCRMNWELYFFVAVKPARSSNSDNRAA